MMDNIDRLISRIIKRERRPRNLGATILWIEAFGCGVVAGAMIMAVIAYLLIK